MRSFSNSHLLAIGTLSLLLCGFVPPADAEDSHAKPVIRNEMIEHGPFIQIPGPPTLISPSQRGEWDGAVVEAGAVFKDKNTYYLS